MAGEDFASEQVKGRCGPGEGVTTTAGTGRLGQGPRGWCVITRSLSLWITSPHVLLQWHDNLHVR